MSYTIHSYRNPLYNSWKDMRKRCYNPNQRAYKWYGGKGIEVCDRWLNNFDNFVRDMLPTYFEGGTLDRIDNDKDYYKENCQWSTMSEQQLNRGNVKGFYKRKDEMQAMLKAGFTYKEVAE